MEGKSKNVGAKNRTVRPNNMKRGHISAFPSRKNSPKSKKAINKAGNDSYQRMNREIVQTVIHAGRTPVDLRIKIPVYETRFTIPDSPTNSNLAFEQYCDTHEKINAGENSFYN